jgi:hypothetical protein
MHFVLNAVAALNDAVSVELPGAALSRRHARDGFDSPSRSRFAGLFRASLTMTGRKLQFSRLKKSIVSAI